MPRNCAPKTCQAVCKCIALLAGSKAKRAELLARVFQDKFHQCDCAEKLCAQDLSSGVQTLGDGTCIARWQGARLKEQSCRHGFFRTNSINAIVPKNYAPETCQMVSVNAVQRDMHGKMFVAGGFSFCMAFFPSMNRLRSLRREAN